MDNASDLRVLLASRHPLVCVEMREEERFLSLLREAASHLDVPVWTWSATRGLARDGQGGQLGTQDPRQALEFVSGVPFPSIFVFVDAHHALGDPLVVRRVKEVAMEARPGQTLVLTGPKLGTPSELDGLAVPWTLKPLDERGMAALVEQTLDHLRSRDVAVGLDEAGVARLVQTLKGLSATEAEHLIQRAAVRDGAVDGGDLAYIRGEKAALLDPAGAIELIEAEVGNLDEVGGLDGLKAWLGLRGRAMDPDAAAYGLDPPRGVLITGVPGCGKSFVAKCLAGSWQLPLVLLDPARLYGPYIGESEQRLAQALHAVDAMSPCVLWIDEIEKGFAASGKGDGGVSQRLRGTFLRWMQERPPGVFVVATSNDVWALPPEFSRKGRFDEIFFVDLPGPSEREAIFRLHLAKRGRDPDSFDTHALVGASEDYSGAEIEATVVGALYRAFADEDELTTDRIIQEIQATVPLARSRSEDIQALRAWSSGRAVAAS